MSKDLRYMTALVRHSAGPQSSTNGYWSNYWADLQKSHQTAKESAKGEGGLNTLSGVTNYATNMAQQQPMLAGLLGGAAGGGMLGAAFGGKNWWKWMMLLSGLGLLGGAAWKNKDKIRDAFTGGVKDIAGDAGEAAGERGVQAIYNKLAGKKDATQAEAVRTLGRSAIKDGTYGAMDGAVDLWKDFTRPRYNLPAPFGGRHNAPPSLAPAPLPPKPSAGRYRPLRAPQTS